MPHDPRNRNCHHPPRKCICDVTSVIPEASPLAPALLAWIDTMPTVGGVSVEYAWENAADHFESEGVSAHYPADPAVFVDLLNYAAPLFDAERSLALDTSHIAEDGMIGVSELRDKFGATEEFTI